MCVMKRRKPKVEIGLNQPGSPHKNITADASHSLTLMTVSRADGTKHTRQQLIESESKVD